MATGRRAQLLTIAAKMMFERGYYAVGMDDIGEAAGISGPALYRHFRSKQHLLAEMLLEPSDRILLGAHRIVAEDLPALRTLDDLVEWHVAATSTGVNVITVYHLWLGEMLEPDRTMLEAKLDEYIHLWIDQIHRVRPDIPALTCRSAVQTLFRMFNMPYEDRKRAARRHDILVTAMAKAALNGVLLMPVPQAVNRRIAS